MMSPEHYQLWMKIRALQIDAPGITFKFEQRLARENGWTIQYARRVVIEYKKFILMCCVSPTGVTPSYPVDQAWHLHLTYTRSYWVDLCKHTLGKEIHHNPTKGGTSEAKKFNNYYTDARTLYGELFGMEAPADIWQDNYTRFTDIDFRRVNIGRHWLIKKPAISGIAAIYLLLIIASGLLMQALYAYIFPVAVFVAIMWGVLSHERRREKDRDNGSGCGGDGCSSDDNGHGHGHDGDSGGDSGCSGCSSSGCSGCGGGGD